MTRLGLASMYWYLQTLILLCRVSLHLFIHPEYSPWTRVGTLLEQRTWGSNINTCLSFSTSLQSCRPLTPGGGEMVVWYSIYYWRDLILQENNFDPWMLENAWMLNSFTEHAYSLCVWVSVWVSVCVSVCMCVSQCVWLTDLGVPEYAAGSMGSSSSSEGLYSENRLCQQWQTTHI